MTYNSAAYILAARNEILLLLHIEMAGNGTREMGYNVSYSAVSNGLVV